MRETTSLHAQDGKLVSARHIRRNVRCLLAYMRKRRLPDWLRTEQYFITAAAGRVLNDLNGVKVLPYAENPAGEAVPYAFLISETIAPGADADEITAALAHIRPDEPFLRTFPTMRAAAVLCRIASHRHDTEAPPMLGMWLLQLHKANRLDWSDIHDALSRVEKTLCADPSGLYRRTSKEGRAAYRMAVTRYAARCHITEEEAAEQALSFAQKAESASRKSIAAWLIGTPDLRQGVFMHLCLYGCALLLTAAAFVWLLPYGFLKALIPACLLLLPFYALCREGADILGGYLACHREAVHPLLRLQLDRIPDEGRSLVVITTLLSGGSHDDVIFDNLKRFYLRNREDNVCFGVLADLPCAKQEVCQEDDAVLRHAESRIAALRKRYGDHFVLLVRKRKYAPGEGVYMGWERKRGAVLTLARYLRGKVRDDAFLYAYTPKNFLLSTVRYVCTLDADTALPAGAVRDMVSVLLHDENKPVIKDGCVVRGCAIVQPRMAVTPMGASATRFTRLCAGQGGSDPYDRYTTDGEEYLYGAGSFCGKGMFDTDAFLEVLDRAFPCDAVLSHDFLEGAVLGCRNLHDVTLQDTLPRSVLSYYERQSRWVRGDTQALRFCFAHYKNADGVRIKNPMPPAMRLRGIDHVLYALMPVAMVRCALLVSFFSLPWYTVVLLWIAAFSARLLRPFLMLFQTSAWRGLFRRFFTSVMPVMRHSMAWLGFRIRFAAYEAWVNLRAFFTALWRMLVSHKHMLAWVTAGEAERKKHADRLSGQFSVFRVSELLGAVLLFSPFLFAKIMGVVWITAPICAFFLNRKENSRRKRRAPIHSDTDADADAPLTHAAILPDAGRYFADMWRYFFDYVNEKTHYLPPDNVQWFPQTKERAAHRTSPTNIGLYLTACVAACDFGLLSPKGLARRLSDTLETLTHMETCRGHFFNWYDTDTAQPLGDRYVSAVDSGNLACALICTAGGAAEYAPEEASLLEIAHALTAMADRMDFTFLFNEDKGLLSLGYDAARKRLSEGCYDLYCSEARSAVYFAAASGQIPARAWERLSRPVTESGGHIGILSWTGSAFEYFMPELWLPVIENTLTEEMLAYAAEAQYASRMVLHDTSGAYPVFGKSEGAFFAFDADKIFQYKPCGVGQLAVCGNMDAEQLVMPYALFLMLPFVNDRIPAAKTLRDLEACGMYGKYGFYEAIDMTRSRVGNGWAVVRSVMAHHLGMSMIALANAVFHGVFVKRFLSDDRMEAMQMLLWERIPTDAAAELLLPARMEHDDAARYQSVRTRNAETESSTDDETEVFGVLSNTYAYVTASSRGDMRFFCGTRAVAAEDYYDESALPPMIFLRCTETGEVYTPFAAGCPDREREQGKVRFSFICTDDEIRYTAQYRNGYTASLRISVSPSDSTFSFTASLERRGEPCDFVMTFFFRPILYPLYAYTVHKTFADLFLSSAWDAEKKQLRFTRRARGEGETDVSMLLSAKGLTDVTSVTDAGALLRVGYTKADILRLGDESVAWDDKKARRGSAAVPIAYLRGYAHGKTILHLTVGTRAAGAQDTDLLADIRWEHRMLCGGITPMDAYVSVMLGALCRHTDTQLLSADAIRKRQPDTRYAVGRERYWQFGLSGDLPIFAVAVDEADGEEAQYRLHAVLHAWKYLLIAGIRSDLVIAVNETDAYENPVQGTVRQQIRECGLEFFIGHGLYLLRHEEAEKNGILIGASHVFDSDGQPVGEDAHAVRQTESEPVRVYEVQHGPGVTAYRMTDNHVLIEKGIQPAPWTYLLTNGVMGTQLTLNTLGFSFFTNARECRVTPWYGEALSERSGEVLYLHIDGEDAFYDLCRSAHIVMLTPHEVHYLGHAGILSFRVSVSIPDRRKRKRIRVFLKNDSDTAVNGTLRYQLRPLLGVLPADREAVMWEWQDNASGDGGAVVFSSLTNAACAPYHAKVYLTGVHKATGGAADDRVYTEGHVSVQAHEGRAADAILQVIRRGEREISDETALPPYRLDLKPVLNTGLQFLDPLANTWLPLQIVNVRMFGRCGYDQPGGAYGFRDQLQDAMAAGMIDASLLRTQIYRAAAHQYVEGDVQHWWHPEAVADPAKSHRGIRSRCSDDYLWLPLAAARYIALTGDANILDTDIRYLESPPLADGENERYETPLRSVFKENLYMHCIRAIEHGRRFGVHGLPLIGIGDWNDGMNRVGVGGEGESVWGGMFLMLVLHTFLPICRSRGDNDGAAQYEEIIKKLAFAIESEAWNGQWYRRAWYDDGTPIGNPGDPCAEIDLLVQSFAAIVNRRVRLSTGAKPFDEKRVHSAMLAAYERLYDKEHEVFALLSPPFKRDSMVNPGDTAAHKPHDPGYIAGYIPGTRENGGQYTHAAVWGAMGLFAVGEKEKGMRVLRALSPIRHTSSPDGILRYRKEPYAMCGDVLMTPGREGEGGWSQYTGSAAWYYRLLREVLSGQNPHGI